MSPIAVTANDLPLQIEHRFQRRGRHDHDAGVTVVLAVDCRGRDECERNAARVGRDQRDEAGLADVHRAADHRLRDDAAAARLVDHDVEAGLLKESGALRVEYRSQIVAGR